MMSLYKNVCAYSQTIYALLQTDYIVFKQNVHNKIIDTFIAIAVNIIVMGYVLPYFGLQLDFGAFMLGGLVASTCIFEIYPFVAHLVSDVSGERKIAYELILPLPSWLIFIKMVLSLALQSMVLSACAIPFGKLLLGSQLKLATISITSCIGMILINSLFAASFGLFIASVIKNMHLLSSVWTRFLFPLWFLGGFQFSWAALNAVFPLASYVSLLNPIVYTNEGFRYALLGQQQFIHVAICIPVLIIFTVLFFWRGMLRFKRRLDFI